MALTKAIPMSYNMSPLTHRRERRTRLQGTETDLINGLYCPTRGVALQTSHPPVSLETHRIANEFTIFIATRGLTLIKRPRRQIQWRTCRL